MADLNADVLASGVLASVVIPAHDEARGLRANLVTLLTGLPPGALDVVVVCNGCSDDTAQVARSVEGVRVLEIPEASKNRAVEVGNRAATTFPRLHLDADVVLKGPDVLHLVAAVNADGVHAAAPERDVPTASSSWPVRAFYRVWLALPQVRDGLFGRGVLVLSESGQRRVDALPAMMSDDLAMSEEFSHAERRVVSEAVVIVRPPRTVGDLVRRRIRVATGNAQYDGTGAVRGATSLRVLAALAVSDLRVAVCLPVFLAVAVRARWGARRAVRAGDFTTWLRDESSRA